VPEQLSGRVAGNRTDPATKGVYVDVAAAHDGDYMSAGEAGSVDALPWDEPRDSGAESEGVKVAPGLSRRVAELVDLKVLGKDRAKPLKRSACAVRHTVSQGDALDHSLLELRRGSGVKMRSIPRPYGVNACVRESTWRSSSSDLICMSLTPVASAGAGPMAGQTHVAGRLDATRTRSAAYRTNSRSWRSTSLLVALNSRRGST
jgi:hypothetical protein